MYMKKLYLLALSCLLLTQCKKDENVAQDETRPEEEIPAKIDFEKRTVEIMTETAPQAVGTWILQEVHINATKLYGAQPLGIQKDTVFKDFATLKLYPATRARYKPVQAKHPEFEGTITLKNKTYPVYFSLLVNPDYFFRSEGPQAFFLFDFNFPDGTRIPEEEDKLLKDLGVVGDNFSFQLQPKAPLMVWKGLNRGVKEIIFKKVQ